MVNRKSFYTFELPPSCYKSQLFYVHLVVYFIRILGVEIDLTEEFIVGRVIETLKNLLIKLEALRSFSLRIDFIAPGKSFKLSSSPVQRFLSVLCFAISLDKIEIIAKLCARDEKLAEGKGGQKVEGEKISSRSKRI